MVAEEGVEDHRKWRLARCLDVFMDELDELHPDRPTESDGSIGDVRHQHEVSDHNPNKFGVVTAVDITAAPFCDELAEKLRAKGPHDGRVKYVIWHRRITSAQHNWQWVAYHGADPHTSHIHLSVSIYPGEYDREDPWMLNEHAVRDLYEGDSGDDVRRLQGVLNAHQYGALIIDGVFGLKTVKAVQRAQHDLKLTVDGVVGPATCKALGL